ncbi:MAG TPA: lipopolysaccharide heptosyltransferase II [Planctomycetota bacterium]|nr:lipopolysaccharide heptosyltransferase II [Planctomycetota bacterium]
MQRILVKEVNWLGDVVMSLPALRAVRKAYPHARLSVLIKKDLASFFDGAAWIDEIIPYKLRKGFFNGLADRRAIVSELKARKFDLAVLLPNSFDAAAWPALAGIPKRAGFSRDARGMLLTHKIQPSAQIREVHQVHYYLHMLKQTLSIDGSPDDYTPDVSGASREKMREFLNARRKRPDKALIGLAVAAAFGPAKEWQAENYARLIDLLAEKHGAECVLAGAPNEREKSERVITLSKCGAILAAGETNVGEAVALLSLCAGFAGNDSGSMHVSGALGKPTVGIYGSTRADRTGPLGPKTKVLYKQIECSPCLERTCRFGHYDCLRMISPEEVAAALEELETFV